MEINLENLSSDGIVLYDIENEEKFVAKTHRWFFGKIFNIEALYNLYINSCFREDDFLINKHLGGYHYISRSPKGFKNREKQFRDELDLNNYHVESEYESDDYRDVRSYSYEEVVSKVGIVNTSDLYNIRRLKFESYLYCILRSNIQSDNKEFNKEFCKLGTEKNFVKYGKNIKLIFKSYWLDEFKPIKQKTWSRI